MGTEVEAFFLPIHQGRRGQRLCLLHRPSDGVVRGTVLYAHPWAEEMNKSRRMAALQARAFAAAGYAAMLIDLEGCGDSSGDFCDASWDGWIDDLAAASNWLHERFEAPLILWGLRAGCLLHCDLLLRVPEAAQQLLFWQPASSGRAVLQQFLRLHSAAAALAGEAGTSHVRPRDELGAGRMVEIAGYRLSAALSRGLDAAKLTPPPQITNSHWFEISMRDEVSLLPATEQACTRWREVGHHVEPVAILGPAFWQTTEVEQVPELVRQSTLAVARRGMV